MERRELLGMMGASAVGLVALSNPSAGAEPEHHHHDKVHDDCMKACGECAESCNEMSRHCLEQLVAGTGDKKYHARSHSLAINCQEFCVLSATLIARGSELMAIACQACAEACNKCGTSCEMEKDSEMMRSCAEKCRKCEATCRSMVKSMQGRDTR